MPYHPTSFNATDQTNIDYMHAHDLVEAHCYSIGRTGQILEQSCNNEKQIECRCFDREGLHLGLGLGSVT